MPSESSHWKFIAVSPVGEDTGGTGWAYTTTKAKLSYFRSRKDHLICCCREGHRLRNFKYTWHRDYLYEKTISANSAEYGDTFIFSRKGLGTWPPTGWTDIIISLILDQTGPFNALIDDSNKFKKLKNRYEPSARIRGELIFDSGFPECEKYCPVCGR
jgi:hypothetical protein